MQPSIIFVQLPQVAVYFSGDIKNFKFDNGIVVHPFHTFTASIANTALLQDTHPFKYLTYRELLVYVCVCVCIGMSIYKNIHTNALKEIY